MTNYTNNNVLYLSYDGLTDPLGQSQVLPYLIGLSKKGYAITIISAEKDKNFEEKKKQISILCKEAAIDWQPIHYTKSPPVLSTLKDIYTLFKKTKKLHKEKQFKLVHCRSYITALLGLHFKRKFGMKFLFDMRGFWANERVDGEIWDITKQPFKMIYNYFKRKEIDFFKEADHIVSLTQNGAKEIASWKEFDNTKLPITVIPCCVDRARFNTQTLQEKEVEDLRQQFSFQDKFVLSYLGSIGTWYMLEEMLDFFKILKQQQKNAVFFFITGESPDYIKDKALSKGINPEDIIVVRVNYTDVPKYLSLSSFSIFFIKPAYSKKASSPVKQGELMSMGIPIVCNDKVGDTDLILEKYNCGFVVRRFENEAYEKTIDLMLKTQLPASSGIKGATDFFSLEKGIEQYATIYKEFI